MSRTLNETELLFIRASAAIAEAERLTEESYLWRRHLHEGISLMRFRARFYPKTLKFYSTVDFLFRLEPCKPLANGTNGDLWLEEGEAIFDPRADNSD